MIVWLNGAFGAGKTTAARELMDLLPGSTLCDPELIGVGLRHMLPKERLAEVGDVSRNCPPGGGWWRTPLPRC